MFLDRFFEFKGSDSLAPHGKNANGTASPTSSILQRDAMTLLDSNARLALQLQALGKDLQTVYRRFKALESSIGLLAAEKKSGNYSNARLHRKGTPGATDVQPIIMQMQKWGRDLQTAAETLSLSRA